jgi:hypothetical protein
MRLESIKKVVALTIIIIFIINCLLETNAVQMTTVKPALLSQLKLESTDYSIINADKNYICIGENIPSKKKVKMSVISKNNYKIVKKYYFDFVSYWNLNSYDGSLLSEGRYRSLSYPTGKKSYSNYIIDIVTGKKVKLKETTVSNISLLTSPDCDIVEYYYQDSSKANTYYGYMKFSTGQTINAIYAKTWHPPITNEWSENGKYTLYYNNKSLFLLSTVNMKQTEICKTTNSDGLFMEWLPNNNGFIYVEDSEIKLYFFKDSRILVTGIRLQEKYINQYNINWNKSKTKFAVYGANDTLYYYNIKENITEQQDFAKYLNPIKEQNPNVQTILPGPEMIWTPDDQKIGIIGPKDTMADALTALIVWNGTKYVNIGADFTKGHENYMLFYYSKRPSYYKHYVLFYSDLELMGNSSTLQNSLKIYDFNNNKLYKIKNVKMAQITPIGNKLIVFESKDIYDFNLTAHLLDENSYILSKTINGFGTEAFDDGNISTPNNNYDCFGGKRLVVSSSNDIYSILDYNKLKKEPLIKFSKNQLSSKDWRVINKTGCYIWNDKSKTMYLYDWNKLIKIPLNKSINSGYSIINDSMRNIIIFNAKGTKNIYIYQLNSSN